jgi:hypothetical protein
MVSNMGVGRNTAPQRVLGFEVTGKQFILDARMLGELTQARRLETNGGKTSNAQARMRERSSPWDYSC